jgi:hypothetical protein
VRFVQPNIGPDHLKRLWFMKLMRHLPQRRLLDLRAKTQFLPHWAASRGDFARMV